MPMSDTDAVGSIDWTTVADGGLQPSASDSMEVELAKISEQARRHRIRVVERRHQEEEEKHRTEEEEMHRRKVSLPELMEGFWP